MKIYFPNLNNIKQNYKNQPFEFIVLALYMTFSVLFIPTMIFGWLSGDTINIYKVSITYAFVVLVFLISRLILRSQITREPNGLIYFLMFSFIYTVLIIFTINPASLGLLKMEVTLFFSGLMFLPLLFVYIGFYRVLQTRFRNIVITVLIFSIILLTLYQITDLLISQNIDQSFWTFLAVIIVLTYLHNLSFFSKRFYLHLALQIILLGTGLILKSESLIIAGFALATSLFILSGNKLIKSGLISNFKKMIPSVFNLKNITLQKVYMSNVFVLILNTLSIIFVYLASFDIFQNILLKISAFQNNLSLVEIKDLIFGHGITQYLYLEKSVFEQFLFAGGMFSVVFLLYWILSIVKFKHLTAEIVVKFALLMSVLFLFTSEFYIIFILLLMYQIISRSSEMKKFYFFENEIAVKLPKSISTYKQIIFTAFSIVIAILAYSILQSI
jgi:hypothetical protein